MKRSSRFMKLFLLLPLVIGIYGFVVRAGEPFLGSVFNCVIMYVMNYGDTLPNLPVEIARWTAPLATASSVVLAVGSLQKWVVSRWKYLRGGSVAVYGPEREKGHPDPAGPAGHQRTRGLCQSGAVYSSKQ